MTPLPGGVEALREACFAADGVDPFQHANSSAPAVVVSREDGSALDAVAWAWHDERGRWSVAAAVHPTRRRQGIGGALVRALLEEVRARGVDEVSAWTTSAGAATDGVAYASDAVLERRMHKLAVGLPIGAAAQLPEGYDLAPLRGEELDAVVAVNAAAFTGHPEQAAMTVDDVRAAESEPWFDRDGFLVLHGPGGVAGFCWTKLHDDTGEGEIFVICTAPSEHGRGLGRAITVAGLAHLAGSTSRGMLYTEETNIPARRLYRSLGFHLERVDTLYGVRL